MDPVLVSQVSLGHISMLKRASSKSINVDFLGEWEPQSSCTLNERTLQRAIFREAVQDDDLDAPAS